MMTFRLFSTVLFLAGLSALPCFGDSDRELTLVAYNVENFFDLDGTSLFEDYERDYPEDPFGYSPEKLWTKLMHAVAVLQTVNGGRGPDVILFQEFENDFSPAVEGFQPDAFLQMYAERTVEAMLTSGWDEAYADIPAAGWMLKAMADAGMAGYTVALGPAKSPKSGIAHVNAVFSRYPIVESHHYEIPQARDIQELLIEVDGIPLWLYNNHWKSGASNPDREPIRVANARILRDLLDRRLAEDPDAEIIVGGDLNAHYNHSKLFPGITTGINDVLGSSGDERFSDNDLYNLWFELPPEARYSEVWRGHRGTLMHLLVSPGLYDARGLSYVDGTFAVLAVPGLNADVLGRPLDWHFAGRSGGGVSDHFPVMARFRVGSFVARGPLQKGGDAPGHEIPLGYDGSVDLDLPDAAALNTLSADALAPHVDRLFRAEVVVESVDPVRLRLGPTIWPAYVPKDSLYKQVRELGVGSRVPLVVRPGFWKGQRQWVVEAILQH